MSDRRLWWPIRFRFHRGPMALRFLDWHGVEVGAEPVEAPWPWRRLLAQTFHFAWGRFQIQTGYPRPSSSPGSGR
jgi:hypothetical protein